MQAYKQGLYGEKVVWIMPNFLSDGWLRDAKTDCTYEQLDLVQQQALYTMHTYRRPG